MKKRIFFPLAVVAAVSVCLGNDSAPAAFVLGNGIICVRAGSVTENLMEKFRSEAPTNSTGGIILDLRFAAGGGIPTASTTEFFAGRKSPLVILVNRQTCGAAADLAAQLQATGAGLVIGSSNSTGAFQPDIAVPTSVADDKIFQANPYALAITNEPAPVATNTLLSFVDHTSEADLVRRKIKDGDSDDAGPVVRAEPARPVIRDPALARAVDLLKALAILRPAHG